MHIHNVAQGSADWLALRTRHFTASEAPAMMGVSPYLTRAELLRQKKTGITPEVDEATQARFDAGHAAEAAARPIAEQLVGEELYPTTGSREVEGLPLLASFDGLTMDGRIAWEHKQRNAAIVAHLVEQREPPLQHVWQLEHQLLVSGAERVLFTCGASAEALDNVWYVSRPERRAQLIAGWHQFAADLADYVPPEIVAPVAAAHVDALPAVSVRVEGALAVISNLDLFGARLRAFVDALPAKPSSDQEFADCEAACKTLKRAEDALEQAEAAALSQTADIEQMRRTVADYAGLARTTRLALDRLVKARKEQLRTEIVARAQQALAEHIERLNARLGRPYMPTVPADFGTAIKGKKTLDSIRSAVDQVLAHAKIAANERHAAIEANMATLRGHAEHAFLFADEAQLVLKLPDDLSAVVQQRIAAHAAAEAKRIEAERERIRAEEEARARAQAERAAPSAAVAPAARSAPVIPPARAGARPTRVTNLSELSQAIGLPLSAAILESLGFGPAIIDRSSRLYRCDDVPAICDALCARITHARDAWIKGRSTAEPVVVEAAQ
jgi:putative phage-type endonuclease